MSDVRVPPVHDSATHIAGVAANGSGGRQAPGEQPHSEARRGQPGAEELAVALHESRRGRLRAHFTIDDDGHALIRIIDHVRNEIVAVLTPEELRQLAEQTGLPSGLLVQTSS